MPVTNSILNGSRSSQKVPSSVGRELGIRHTRQFGVTSHTSRFWWNSKMQAASDWLAIFLGIRSKRLKLAQKWRGYSSIIQMRTHHMLCYSGERSNAAREPAQRLSMWVNLNVPSRSHSCGHASHRMDQSLVRGLKCREACATGCPRAHFVEQLNAYCAAMSLREPLHEICSIEDHPGPLIFLFIAETVRVIKNLCA